MSYREDRIKKNTDFRWVTCLDAIRNESLDPDHNLDTPPRQPSHIDGGLLVIPKKGSASETASVVAVSTPPGMEERWRKKENTLPSIRNSMFNPRGTKPF